MCTGRGLIPGGLYQAKIRSPTFEPRVLFALLHLQDSRIRSDVPVCLGVAVKSSSRVPLCVKRGVPSLSTKDKVRRQRGRGEDTSGACAGDAVPAGEAAPPAVRVTLKSGDAGAQWQRDLGGMACTTGFSFRVVVATDN